MPKLVADEDDVGAGLVHDARGRVVVGRQADEALAALLARAHGGHGHFLGTLLFEVDHLVRSHPFRRGALAAETERGREQTKNYGSITGRGQRVVVGRRSDGRGRRRCGEAKCAATHVRNLTPASGCTANTRAPHYRRRRRAAARRKDGGRVTGAGGRGRELPIQASTRILLASGKRRVLPAPGPRPPAPVGFPKRDGGIVRGRGEQFGVGSSEQRVRLGGGEFGERREDEAAEVEARVGQSQKLRVAPLVAVSQEVEVDGARGEGARAASAQRVLDLEEPREEFVGRGERGADEFGDHVEVRRLLVADADRLGLVDGREARDAQPRVRHAAHAEQQVPGAVAEVRPHADVRAYVARRVVRRRRHLQARGCLRPISALKSADLLRAMLSVCQSADLKCLARKMIWPTCSP